MDRSKLIRYGTIALIVFFAIEILAMLFTQNPYANLPVPTPTPSPTPVPPSFDGYNDTQAYVIGLQNELLIYCNTTQDLESIVKNNSAVAGTAYDVANTRIDVALISNASLDNAISNLRYSLASVCSARFYKRATLSFDGLLNFTSLDGANSQLLSASALNCFSQISSAPCYGFVRAPTKENITVDITVALRMQGEAFSFAQAIEREPPYIVSINQNVNADATVLQVFEDATSEVSIPWNERSAFSQELLDSRLNKSSLNYSNANFYSDDTIGVNSTANVSLDAFKNLSFAKSVVPFNNQPLIQVDSNFTDDAFVISELAKLNVTKDQIIFPSSRASVDFIYTNSSKEELTKVYSPYIPKYARRVLVALTNTTQVEAKFGVPLPVNQFQLYMQNPTEGEGMQVLLSGVLRDGELVSLNAQAIEDQ